MKVCIDGRKIEDGIEQGCTLQQLIDTVRQTQPADRLVVAVTINGQLCGDEELSSRLGQPIDANAEVELETGDRTTLAADALRAIGEQIAAMGPRHGQIAEQLNAGQLVEAIQEVSDYVTLWRTCSEAVVQCSGLLGQDLTAIEFSGKPIRAYSDELADRLREIRDALEARDMVLLADLLQYEMPTMCDTWSSMMRTIAQVVSTPESLTTR